MVVVGPLRALKLPGQAAMVAQPGDNTRGATGVYLDSALWRADRLTIKRESTVAILDG
jgi:hypothetical protein